MATHLEFAMGAQRYLLREGGRSAREDILGGKLKGKVWGSGGKAGS